VWDWKFNDNTVWCKAPYAVDLQLLKAAGKPALRTALHFAFYNFCRVHGSFKATPAMVSGLTERPWSIAESRTLGVYTVPQELFAGCEVTTLG
jgi:hypothetical protein